MSLVLAFIGDLLFSSRLEDAAEKQGLKTILIENASYFSSPDTELLEFQYAEHTTGPGAILVERISAWRPALIIFDLNNQAVPWHKWIALIKICACHTTNSNYWFWISQGTRSVEVCQGRRGGRGFPTLTFC